MNDDIASQCLGITFHPSFYFRFWSKQHWQILPFSLITVRFKIVLFKPIFIYESYVALRSQIYVLIRSL